MWGLELIDEAEGVLVSHAIEKLQRQITGDVRGVSLDATACTVVDEFRIEILALSGMDTPMIKAARVLADMILAHKSGSVASLLQQLGEGGHLGREFFHIVRTL